MDGWGSGFSRSGRQPVRFPVRVIRSDSTLLEKNTLRRSGNALRRVGASFALFSGYLETLVLAEFSYLDSFRTERLDDIESGRQCAGVYFRLYFRCGEILL